MLAELLKGSSTSWGRRNKGLIEEIFVGLHNLNEAHQSTDEDKSGGKPVVLVLVDNECTMNYFNR